MRLLNFSNLILPLSFLALSGANYTSKINDLEKKFDEWIAKYEKEYYTNEEKLKRLKIWSDNYGT